MLVKIIYLALFACVSFKSATGNDSCDHLGVLLYEEIGCKPSKDKPSDTCPSSYDCTHLQERGNHCFFQGKKYINRESLPDGALFETCNAGCFCESVFSPSNPELSFAKFTCGAFDCAEFIGGSPLKNPNCTRTYKLGSCCSAGQICPPFDNVSTCKVDGGAYMEGQRFSPRGQCSNCVCQKGFGGKYEAPFCKRKACAVELRHTQDIKGNCAPVYQKEDARCCPYSWICPLESDTFTAPLNNTSAKTCKFGQKEIKAGEVLQRTLTEYGKTYEVKCDCQLPPLLTCIIEH